MPEEINDFATSKMPRDTAAAAGVRGQESLLRTRALQDAIFNSANFSSIATDAKGVIQIFNVGAERMLGYAAAEVMDKVTPADISDPQEVIVRAKALSAELGTPITPGFEALVFKASRGIEDIYELTYIRKDGSRFPAVVSVTALRDDQGTIIGYLLIGTDNTARKQTEEALRKAGALQNAIFNSANFSSIATDAKGVIQIFNVGAERMLGYAAAEVMDKVTPADISDPQEVIARAKALSAELGTPITPGFEALVFKASRGIEDIYELTYIRKDGSRFPAVVSVTALRDDQGTIIGYLLIGTDNTARKQTEEDRKLLDQRLRDQQFYTRSLLESNIDALMTTDPSGIISDVNKQMEVLTGCTRDELIGSPFTGYFTDPERALGSLKLVLSQKKVTNYELTARARDGTETVVSYNATTYYDRDRRLQGMFAAARDITERKALEESVRRRSAELSAANKELEAFSYSVSHDLRSPLRSIDGFSQAFLEDYGSLVPKEGREDLERVRHATERMEHLIDDMLLLSRVTRREMHMEETNVTALATEVAGDFTGENPQRDVQLNIEPGMTVTGDPQLLRIVLVNLLGNAWKFTSKREHAHISVGTMHDPEHGRAFFVRDDGAGFDPKYKDKLFVAFQRLHGQDEFPGTGIGLATIQRAIRRHGGNVWAEGEVDRGATFFFTVPDSHISMPAEGEQL